jgi:hypothetical protein
MEPNEVFATEACILDNFMSGTFPSITILRENKLTGLATCIGIGKLDYILHDNKKIWFVNRGCSFTFESIKSICFSPENGVEITLKMKNKLDGKGD